VRYRTDPRVSTRVRQQFADQLVRTANASGNRARQLRQGVEQSFSPANPALNGESLNRYNDILFNPDYRRLFPFGGKIIFDGCEVAAGDDGTAFLAAVGRAFFKKSGGVVIGPTRLQIVLTGPLYYALVAVNGPFFTMARGRSVQLNVLGKTSFIGAYKAAVFTPGGFLIHVGFL